MDFLPYCTALPYGADVLDTPIDKVIEEICSRNSSRIELAIPPPNVTLPCELNIRPFDIKE